MLANQIPSRLALLAIAALAISLPGCASRCGPVNAIPANQVRNATCCEMGNNEKINFLTLRRAPVDDYVLGAGDTMGVYIQGITGDKETPPPVHFPEDSEMQPAVGYPVPVRDDGNISLPLIQPIRVEGLTLGQAETRIRNAYTRDREILQEGNEKIIVTLMKRRTVNVLVIREDASDNRTFTQRSNETFIDDQKQGQTFSLDLPIYKNDVLHALSETGGMPSEGAVNEIVILRDGMNQMNQQAGLITDAHGEASGGAGSVVRIPIEGSIDQFPDLTEEDITLNEGDIVYICLLYTSPSPRDLSTSRMPSSA